LTTHAGAHERSEPFAHALSRGGVQARASSRSGVGGAACRGLPDDGAAGGARQSGVGSSGVGSSGLQQNGGAAAEPAGGHIDSTYVQSSWAEMLLGMPLELAAASAKTNDHWLQKRKRKHWWKREQFPRVWPRTSLRRGLSPAANSCS